MKRWIVKIGSALLTAEGRGLDETAVRGWVAQMVALRAQGAEVILVSSGAVAQGMSALGVAHRPHQSHELRALAAVGQAGLVRCYEESFGVLGVRIAQVLLTNEDLRSRDRYLNARSMLWHLLQVGVVPVVNENDSVTTDDTRLGDNDTLAGLVANLVEADRVVLLTDRDGLLDADPSINQHAALIPVGKAGDPALYDAAGEGSALGRGGMRTKLQSAELAARSGTDTVIANGRTDDVLVRLYRGERLGTHLRAGSARMTARKRWMASQLRPAGSVSVDAGAAAVLLREGRSLLPVGVRDVQGSFERGALVCCVSLAGDELARGLSNYSSAEARLIAGLPSSAIEQRLGFAREPELIHRDNLIVTQTADDAG